jgi:hypothetical protein
MRHTTCGSECVRRFVFALAGMLAVLAGTACSSQYLCISGVRRACDAPRWDMYPFSRVTLAVRLRDPRQVALVSQDGRVIVPPGSAPTGERSIDSRAVAYRGATGELVARWEVDELLSHRRQFVLPPDGTLEFEFKDAAARASARVAVGVPDGLRGAQFDLPFELALSAPMHGVRSTYVSIPCRLNGLCVHLVMPRSNVSEIVERTVYTNEPEQYQLVNYAKPPPDREVRLYP